MGAAFGSGASGSLFGASGSANFLSRATAVLATVFFFTSMGLTYFSLQNTKPTDVMQKHAAPPARQGRVGRRCQLRRRPATPLVRDQRPGKFPSSIADVVKLVDTLS